MPNAVASLLAPDLALAFAADFAHEAGPILDDSEEPLFQFQTIDTDASIRSAAIDALHEATAIYTCEPIVEQLLDRINWPAADKSIRTLVDTSCGDGAFLGKALERLLLNKPSISDADLLSSLSGWEIHLQAADQSRDRLRQILMDNGYDLFRANSISTAMVTCADFLTEGPVGAGPGSSAGDHSGDQAVAYHAIVGNPPYLRFTNVPQPLRGEYEDILPDYAQADLLQSFLDRCVSLLHTDGELAMVTADRWLFNSGAARLREVVGQRFGLAHVQRLDVASTFYRPKNRRAGTPPRVHPVAVVLKPTGTGTTPITRAPIYPGEAAYVAPIAALTLGDVAEVRLAPWLGTPGVFLITHAIAAAAGLPILSLVPAIDTHDILNGVLQPAARFAILTRPGEEPPASVLAHLDGELHRMAERGRRKSDRWLPPESFHNFDLAQPSLLVARIAKALRPVHVPPGILPVNHSLSIVRSGVMDLVDIEHALRSEISNEWVQHHAAPLEGGYRSLTARLLRTMPVVA